MTISGIGLDVNTICGFEGTYKKTVTMVAVFFIIFDTIVTVPFMFSDEGELRVKSWIIR